MEQLTRQEIEGLNRLTRGLAATRSAAGALWQKRAAPPNAGLDSALPLARHVDTAPGSEVEASVDDPHALPAAAPMLALERRLARRAETAWDRLRGQQRLPPASAVAHFMAPPFAASSLLIALPRDGSMSPPRIVRIGDDLQVLGVIQCGGIAPDSRMGAKLGARLVALAIDASDQAMPLTFDSEGGPAFSGSAGHAPLLMRAIALPFPADGANGPQVVVVTSWRELLSANETEALHRELAAAIGWMHAHRPPD